MRRLPTPRTAAPPADGPSPYFLVVDDRFRVPIFVFVEVDPRRPARAVTIEPAPAGEDGGARWAAVGAGTSLARHPSQWDRFKEFPSDGHARAAGFLPIEPRYVGPSWESYLRAFRPEGERPPKAH